ncbi:MAG: hypothetical protein R2748_30180 [Bryobacterales bacterium]
MPRPPPDEEVRHGQIQRVQQFIRDCVGQPALPGEDVVQMRLGDPGQLREPPLAELARADTPLRKKQQPARSIVKTLN